MTIICDFRAENVANSVTNWSNHTEKKKGGHQKPKGKAEVKKTENNRHERLYDAQNSLSPEAIS